MENIYDFLSKATVQVCTNNSRGSGFLFRDKRTIITNYHVVEEAHKTNSNIYLKTWNNLNINVGFRDGKYDSNNDFAILVANSDIPEVDFFEYKENALNLGDDIIFSGFPHGIEDLISNNATISNIGINNFTINGLINGGNSGGPVVNKNTGNLIGIVYARRFIKGELENIVNAANNFYNLALQQSKQVMIQVGGVNYNLELAKLLCAEINILNNVILSNANTGIGHAYKIDSINEYLNSLNI